MHWLTYEHHAAIKGKQCKDGERRQTTDIAASLSLSPATNCSWWSVFICFSDCRCLTHRADQTPPPVAYTTSLLEHSSVIMTLHDSTLIRSDSPRWSQHPSVLQLAPPLRRRANQWRWDASVCKCWVWTINYVGLACRGHSLTLFNTDFPKKKKKMWQSKTTVQTNTTE